MTTTHLALTTADKAGVAPFGPPRRPHRLGALSFAKSPEVLSLEN